MFEVLAPVQAVPGQHVSAPRHARPPRRFVQAWLLALAACCLMLATPRPAHAGSILREVFQGIGGTSVADLTNHPAYPSKPSYTNFVTTAFEAPTDSDDNYGQRMHGYVVPPVTGNYTFWIASDDGGSLFLSTDDNPANVKAIAYVSSWTSSREWGKEPNQQSAPVRLEAGRAYYISALQKEGGGGDNLAVRWLRPDGVDEGPIPATYLLPWGTTFAPPVIVTQPADTSAVEGQLAQFTVAAKSFDASVQWKRNGTAIPGATGLTLSYGPVTMDDNGARFVASLTNRLGGVDSNPATLTVLPDTTPPTVVSAINLGATSILVQFSEPVSDASASNPANFAVTGGVNVTAAAVRPDRLGALITVSALAFGSPYTVTVNGVQDRARTPNTVPANSTASFVAREFVSQDIGTSGGSIQRLDTGSWDASGRGADIGGTSDQFQFGWEQRTGNFDIQVRVASADATDPFVHAGLMARSTLDANAPFAAAFSGTPQVGCFYEARASAGGASTMAAPSGGFPANPPQTWLRLRRSANTFTAFGSLDGQTWVQLGSSSVTMPSTVYVGIALSSGNATKTATARFRDYGATASLLTGTYTPTREPLGPASRRTGIVFSEVMYHGRGTGDAARRLEFVELYNADTLFQDLTGWRIAGDVDYAFPAGTVLPAGGFLAVAADPQALAAAGGAPGLLGPYAGTLGHSSGTLRLLDATGAVKLEFAYDSQPPWPAAADGTGHSLSLVRPSYGHQDPRAWGISEQVGGSPGRFDTVLPNPQATVTINEVLANPEPPQAEYVELYNRGNTPVDLGGCFLTDSPLTNRFRIPDGTTIPARGLLSFDRATLGFGLSSSGETVYLVSSNQARVVDAVRYGPQERGVALGRSPDGSDTLRRLAAPTPAQPNAPWRAEDLVVNELMYSPISGDSDDEYVELYNRGSGPLDVSDWRLANAVTFRIPDGTVVPAGGYLVIGRNVDRLRANYPQLTAANSLGNYSGSLGNSGDRLVLTRPQLLVSTNDLGDLVTNKVHCAVTEVVYSNGGRWGRFSDGGGSSLELVDPRADPLRPSNWADSDETQKASWQTYTVSTRVELGMDGTTPNRVRLGMLGMGEVLVDDVEVLGPDNVNRVANGGFESGTTGWTFTGNHSTSGVDAFGAATGTRCLHIRAQGDNDTGINSIRANLSPALAAGNNVTLRFKARWLAGWPEMLMRIHGNYAELAPRLAIPANLGTPGQPNSRRVDNAGPAVYAVNHTPALPRANQSVVVTCRVSDPDGIASVNLRFRVDPGTSYSTVAMRDDGTGGDAVAGDGVYSATISGRAAGTMVGFNIVATDAAAAGAAAATFPSAQIPFARPSPECLVRWDDPVPLGNFAHYHLWSSAANEALRTNPLNNTYREATLVYGNFRVIYQAGFRDKGSPYHGGGGSIAAMNGDDEPLLGTTERVFRSTGNGGQESTGLRNALCAWIGRQMGIPYLHTHYMQLYRNGGQQYNVSVDAEAPSNDYARGWFPDNGAGDLYKIAIWFEFDDNNSGFNAVSATLQDFRAFNGARSRTRYRWNWQTRGYQGSANNYTNIFNLVALANDTTPNFVPNLLRDVDVDEWMRVFAYHRVLGNWDSYAFNVGQNMYLFKQPEGRYVILPWDIDFTLGDGDGPSGGLWGGQDPVINTWFDNPALRRMLWRGFIDAVNGPMDPANYGPVIAARRAALLKNGIGGLADPAGVDTYIKARRAFLQQQIAANDAAAFAITTAGGKNFDSTTPFATLEGRAPFAVASVLVNGVEYPTTWTTPVTFSVRVPLGAATNVLALSGVDRKGNAVPGAAATLTVRYTGALQAPQDFLVINEIHYNPVEPGTSFVEVFNNSALTPFDLSGWRLEGVGLTFPDGTVLQPGAYGVVAKDRAALAAAYGAGINVLAEFPGTLSNGGENLRLVKPLGLGGTNDLVVSDVRYDQSPPWPTNANGFGPSLQLIDPGRGAYRVANWAVTETNAPNRATPGRFNATKSTLGAFQNVWINEVLPNNVGGPADGAGERDPYIELYNAGTTVVSLASLYLSDAYDDLTRWRFPSGTTLGPGQFVVVWADGQPAQSTATEFHTGFRLNPTNGTVALSRIQAAPAVLDYVTYRQVPAGRSVGLTPDGEPRSRRSLYYPTAGAANNPAFPRVQVTFNEFMAANVATLVNFTTGKADDWFELHNGGTDAVDLTGYTLTDDPAVPAKFTVPGGFVIPPSGFLLVWADRATAANATDTDLHVGFRLSKAGGYLGLFGPDGVAVDAITYGTQAADISQGRFPDGGDLPLATFNPPTPRASNGLAGGNQAPVLAQVPAQSVDEQQLLQFTAQATDPDAGQSLSFSLGADAPPGAEIDAVTGRFQWTPNESQGPGSYSFAVRVTDNGTPPRSAVQRVAVTVNEANRPPVLPEIADRTVDEGSVLAINAAAADPDLPANAITYALGPGAPAGAAIDPATGAFAWTPSEEQGPGTYDITIVARDNGNPPLQDSRTFKVAVNEVDNPPVLAQVLPQSVDEGATLTVAVKATDPDNPPSGIAYTLEGELPAGIVIDPVTGVVTWTPTEAQGPGTYVVVVRATEQDAKHLSTARSFGITVNEVNRRPVLGPLPTLVAVEGDVVGLAATATDPDLPLQSLFFSLGTDVVPGASIDPQTGFFTYATPDDVGATTNRITLYVNDGGPGNLGDNAPVTVVTTPRFRAVINEVLYRPEAANSSFIELFNPSTITTQDLSGVVVNGENLRYAFPAGARLEPGRFLVLAQNRAAFAAAFGAVPVFGEWNGTLDRFNTRLVVQRPDGNGGLVVEQQVDYRATLPWPANADVPGASLQLVDPRRDGSRVGNWDAATGITWRRVVQTGTASSSSLYLYLENVGEAYIDDIRLVAGTDPDAGDNLIPNGDFESALTGPWTVSPNLSGSVLSTTVKHAGNASLRMVSTTAGTTRGSSIWQDLNPGLASGAAYTLSYWYLPNPAGGTLTLRLSGSGIKSTTNIAPDVAAVARATPGRTNSTAAALPAFPPVWINEVAPENRTGLADASGRPRPWLELVNTGSVPVDLSGWSLTTNYADLAAWRFPAGASVPPNGFLVVFADGQPANGGPGELHTSFALAPTNGAVALCRPVGAGGPLQVADYLEYANAKADTTAGRDPRGFPYNTRVFTQPTPGAPNLAPVAPPVVGASVAQDGKVSLRWTTQVGRVYRVEVRNDLNSPWQTLKEFTADAADATVADAPGDRTERYYRIVSP